MVRRAGVLLGAAVFAIAAAAACGVASAQDTTPAAQNEYRIQQLEEQVRALTGQVETQSHQLQVLQQQLDQMRAGGAQGGPDAGSGPVAQDNYQPAPAVPPVASEGAPTPLYPGAGAQVAPPAPHYLGSIPAGPVPTVDPDTDPGYQAATTPQGQYQAAYALIGEGRFDEAERAFRAFLKQYPKNPLASSAAYWVGHTFYARGDFQNAAVAFADGYKKYPSGIKAPDTLLDLGRSLGKLGNAQDACATFAQFDQQFGVGATPAIKKQEQQEKVRLRCG